MMQASVFGIASSGAENALVAAAVSGGPHTDESGTFGRGHSVIGVVMLGCLVVELVDPALRLESDASVR